ncbi:MAG: hypothetical protein C0483_07205 [Pirellula sp.]|nr:hypothetical protein [Pirellula sp.]
MPAARACCSASEPLPCRYKRQSSPRGFSRPSFPADENPRRSEVLSVGRRPSELLIACASAEKSGGAVFPLRVVAKGEPGMYEEFFGMKQRPFCAAPRSELYFPSRVIEPARQTIERTIERAEGSALVVGPAGTGKTMLCRLMAEKFRSRFDVAFLSNGRLPSRRALLQAILFELGMPYRKLDEGELRLALLDRLQPNASGSEGLLLIVDEAHLLPLRLMEEVRLITDFMRGGKPRVRLVLAGSAALEERLTAPRLNSLQQRITARCYLEALDRSETLNFIRHQIAASGADPATVFTDAGLEAAFRAGDGIPRLVNQICDHALVMACAGEVKPVDARGIEEAWSDLQQLPTPWSEAPGYSDPRAVAEDTVVEFGLLDDGTDVSAPHELPTVETVSQAPRMHVPSEAEMFSPVLPVDMEQETEEKLCELESHLADWEADYEPVIAKQPEVEIMLSETRRNPFGEDFVEELPIVDRYLAAERLHVVARSQVRSEEGRAIAELLGVREPTPRSMSKPIERADAGATQRPVLRPQPAQIAPQSPHLEFPIVDVVEPEDFVIAPRRSTSDADMIILEDEPSTVQTPEAVLVRKQEFRQLFSRLRTGK